MIYALQTNDSSNRTIRRPSPRLLVSLLALPVVLTASTAAMATDYTWVGGSGGSWVPAPMTTPWPWSPVGVPGAGDTVTISGATLSGATGAGLVGLTLTGGATITDGTIGIVSGGTFNWESGELGGNGMLTVTLAAGSTTNISGVVHLAGAELDNYGTLNWTAGTLAGDSDDIFRNFGTLNITTGSTGFIYGSGVDTADFYNTGTVNVTGGGTVGNQLSGGLAWGFHNSATVNLTGASTMEWIKTSDTLHTLDDGGTITGNGTLLFDDSSFPTTGDTAAVTASGKTTVATGATLALGVGSELSLGATGATFVGPGAFVWTGGWITGDETGPMGTALTWSPTLAVHLTGAAQKEMTGAYIVNQTSPLWDAGDLGIGDGSYLMNTATFTAKGALNIVPGNNATAPTLTLENHGTVLTTGTGQLTAASLAIVNYGAVTATGSSLYVVSTLEGSPIVLEAGSTLGGAITTTGEVTLNGASAIATGGTLELTSTATGGANSPTALLDGSGTISGAGTVKIDGAIVTVSTGSSITLESNVLLAANTSEDTSLNALGSLTLAGTTLWTGGEIVLETGTLSNTGSFTMQTAGPLTFNDASFFANTGTFTADPGAAATAEIQNAMTNAGTVVVKSGTLLLSGYDSPNYTQTAGQTELAGGNVASNDSSTPPNYFGIDIQGGSLTGSGTVDSPVTCEGIVAPGTATSAGTLTITQTYVQSSTGTLDIGLGGTGAGQFDVLAVSGDVTLAGGLTVSRIGGYVPVVADTYKVITSGGADPDSGMFATVTDPTGVTLTTTYDPNDVALGVTQVSVPEAGAPDGGAVEAGFVDAGTADAGNTDAATHDASTKHDAGTAKDAATGTGPAPATDASTDGGMGSAGSSGGCALAASGSESPMEGFGTCALAALVCFGVRRRRH